MGVGAGVKVGAGRGTGTTAVGTICGAKEKGGKNGGLLELGVGNGPALGVVIGIVATPVGGGGAEWGMGIKGEPTRRSGLSGGD